MTVIEDVVPQRAINQFELDYAAQKRRAKLGWLIASILFVAFFAFSAWLGDFFKLRQVTNFDGSREWRWIIPAGLPRLEEFIEKTLPVLSWDSVGANLSEWFWR